MLTNERSKYTVYAGPTGDHTDDHGFDYDCPADTIAEAKEKAREAISKEFAVSNEMSAPFGYACVMDRRGACVYEVGI